MIMKLKRLLSPLVLLLYTNVCVLFAVNDFRFEKFPLNDKLPSNSVLRIYNDKEGYFWFGTMDGLARFDGYDVKIFRSSPLTPGKLINNEIRCIAEDTLQKIWVGTPEGIVIIDKKSYRTTILKNQFIKGDNINSIITDRKGYVWIATTSYGVIRMHPETFEYERYSTDSDASVRIKSNTITYLYEDNKGKIWLTAWKAGLCYLDPENKKAVYCPPIGKTNNPFRCFQDNDGLFWICTWGDGIFHLTETNEGKMKIEKMPLSKKSELEVDDIVYSITQDDKTGLIWVITFSDLSNIRKENDGTFTVTSAHDYFEESSMKLFHDIVKDRKGNLWIGSVGDGIYKLDFNRLNVKNFNLPEIISNLNIPPYVTHIAENENGEIFISINRIGIFRFYPETGSTVCILIPEVTRQSSVSTLLHIKSSNKLLFTLEGEDQVHICAYNNNGLLTKEKSFAIDESYRQENIIHTLFEDSRGNIWIGTNNGIYLKPLNGKSKLFSKKYFNVNSFAEDKYGNIWFGTAKDGVFFLTPKVINGRYTFLISAVPLKIGNFRSVNVLNICSTTDGTTYIGTREGCLFRFERELKKANDISGIYGITEEGIMDIVSDSNGYLWISTIKKIIRFNPPTHTATYFTKNDGLLIDSYYRDAGLLTSKGIMMFGGNKGICAFNTLDQTSLKTDTVMQKVSVTDILIQNKSIYDFADNSHFDEKHRRLQVKPNENNLSFEFSTLIYPSSIVQYAYKMSDVDNDWILAASTRRFVNYANLPPGNYTFSVKATNEDGTWSNKITSVNIKILPPWYRTWLAYLIYLIAGIVLIIIIVRTVYYRIQLRNELKISQIEKKKTEELSQIKLRYFTNISHELLTPLTVISLQIERLQKKISGFEPQFDIMKENVVRLKRLIKQILVFRKTESGNMKLKVVKDDVISFVKNICNSGFKLQITEKEINFTIDVQYESYQAWFDPDKLDKIVYNLLSNAFKFTPYGGSIALKISFVPRQESVFMRLSVSDSGIGISESELPHIFKRFYISSNSDMSQSHGIGLSLTNDLLQIHKGNISVKSQPGEGSVFTFEIPISEDAYTIDEKAPDDLNVEMNEETEKCNTDTGEIKSLDNKSLSVLIVEDNQELNKIIAENFSEKFNVYTAQNGIQALQIIREKEIDIIISDVMMPEMDGLTLCKIVKNDLDTSHISILMLTAKNSVEDRIDCYNAGADGYIAKPFELDLLNARVNNLISKKIQKNETFRRNTEINISEMEYSSVDEVFLKQAIAKVEEKLSDELFDFDQFAMDMATSKSTLHRKLKSLTGLSPGEFIRNVRLKHAVQMLTNNTGNISEIAFAVGFNDPKYFSRCFKAEYGMTPKEFQEDKRAKKQV